MILLDNMIAGGYDPTVVKPAGGRFSRMFHPQRSLCEARNNPRFHRSLKIDRKFVLLRLKLPTDLDDLMMGSTGKRRLAPAFGINDVDRVDQGTRRITWAGTKSVWRAQQLHPALLDDPADECSGPGIAQSGNRGQRVNNVSHSSETHDKNALGHTLRSRFCTHERLRSRRLPIV